MSSGRCRWMRAQKANPSFQLLTTAYIFNYFYTVLSVSSEEFWKSRVARFFCMSRQEMIKQWITFTMIPCHGNWTFQNLLNSIIIPLQVKRVLSSKLDQYCVPRISTLSQAEIEHLIRLVTVGKFNYTLSKVSLQFVCVTDHSKTEWMQ